MSARDSYQYQVMNAILFLFYAVSFGRDYECLIMI